MLSTRISQPEDQSGAERFAIQGRPQKAWSIVPANSLGCSVFFRDVATGYLVFYFILFVFKVLNLCCSFCSFHREIIMKDWNWPGAGETTFARPWFGMRLRLSLKEESTVVPAWLETYSRKLLGTASFFELCRSVCLFDTENEFVAKSRVLE